MRKDEKKGLFLSVFIIILCFFISIFTALYIIIPKDKFNIKIKNYYIDAAVAYFNDYENDSITINTLIKKGYASKNKEMEKNLCNYKTSYISKEKNKIKLVLSCKKYAKDYIVVIP